jgi:hypothetical protein
MEISRNTHFFNSSLLFKILAIACIPALVFVIIHMILGYMERYPVAWLRELHSIVQNGLPFFLFLTGSFIRNKKLRIPLLIFFPLFFIAYTLKTLDFHGIIDIHPIKLGEGRYINIVKWILCPALLGLMITYTIHFFAKKQKIVLDYLKILWFLVIGYVLLSVYFPVGFKVMRFFEVSTWLVIVLMIYGLINYFRKPSE